MYKRTEIERGRLVWVGAQLQVIVATCPNYGRMSCCNPISSGRQVVVLLCVAFFSFYYCLSSHAQHRARFTPQVSLETIIVRQYKIRRENQNVMVVLFVVLCCSISSSVSRSLIRILMHCTAYYRGCKKRNFLNNTEKKGCRTIISDCTRLIHHQFFCDSLVVIESCGDFIALVVFRL